MLYIKKIKIIIKSREEMPIRKQQTPKKSSVRAVKFYMPLFSGKLMGESCLLIKAQASFLLRLLFTVQLLFCSWLLNLAYVRWFGAIWAIWRLVRRGKLAVFIVLHERLLFVLFHSLFGLAEKGNFWWTMWKGLFIVSRK